jgi:diguanylate cyclase (GGDEF)-like protein
MAVGASEVGTSVWCVFIDVRGLKQVNDTNGHDAGDDLLRAVGRALSVSQVVRGVAARWGGDEFCIVGVGDPPLLEVAALDLRSHMDALPLPEASWDLSLGLAAAPTVDGDFLLGLIAQADEDMYRRRGTEGRRSSASS